MAAAAGGAAAATRGVGGLATDGMGTVAAGLVEGAVAVVDSAVLMVAMEVEGRAAAVMRVAGPLGC